MITDERKGWVDMFSLLLLSILAVSDLSLRAQGKSDLPWEEPTNFGGNFGGNFGVQVPVRTVQLRQGRRFSATTRARRAPAS